ncbi:MAG TPA: rhodanese-like domain-containing protein [Pyrinomonadaceae bacterium]
MEFKQFYLGCLAHASYYIGSDGEAAVIDPQRDVEQYLAEARAHNQKIKYIIETHSHADFVSGHVELAAKTGAEIVYGERAATRFPTRKVKDGDALAVGKIRLRFLETPGHTPEGITIVAEDTGNAGAPLKIFTGDTLFIGDVGRPDLIGSKGFTADEMAGMLYDSLHEKILPLPDDTEVYPAHGAGSLCGKSLSKETWSTLGEQRRSNYALQSMSKEEFIKLVASNQPEVPAYFPKSAAKNLEGSGAIDDLPKPEALTSETIEAFDGIVLDVRAADEFGAGHIPGAVNIGLGGQFASWAGTLIEIGTPLVVAAQTDAQVAESVTRLARVGVETVQGFILMKDWRGEVKTIAQVAVGEVGELARTEKNLQLVDVRRAGEYAGGHAAGARNIPLDKLSKQFDKLDPSAPTYVICQGGYRSSAGTSLLERAGFSQIYNVTGGTAAWIGEGLELEREATAGAV